MVAMVAVFTSAYTHGRHRMVAVFTSAYAHGRHRMVAVFTSAYTHGRHRGLFTPVSTICLLYHCIVSFIGRE
jgi:hypothetical protein